MPSGLLRRRFLAVLDTGSAALAARSARVLASYVQGEEQGSQNGESASQHAARLVVSQLPSKP